MTFLLAHPANIITFSMGGAIILTIVASFFNSDEVGE